MSRSSGEEEAFDADAVVFGVGVKAMQGIVRSSPDLAACPVGIPLTNLLFVVIVIVIIIIIITIISTITTITITITITTITIIIIIIIIIIVIIIIMVVIIIIIIIIIRGIDTLLTWMLLVPFCLLFS